MNTKQNAASVNIIYWITNVSFWFYVLVSFFGFFLALGFITGWVHNTQINIGVPLAYNIIEKGVLHLNGDIIKVQFTQMYGNISIDDTPVYITRVYGVFIIIMLAILVYIFKTFKEFVSTIYRGCYFDRKNIMSLKRIAYAIVLVWFFRLVYLIFQYFYLVKNIEIKSADFSGQFQTYPLILLFALFIWVLSHIFQKGVELQKENELTI